MCVCVPVVALGLAPNRLVEAFDVFAVPNKLVPVVGADVAPNKLLDGAVVFADAPNSEVEGGAAVVVLLAPNRLLEVDAAPNKPPPLGAAAAELDVLPNKPPDDAAPPNPVLLEAPEPNWNDMILSHTAAQQF